jgi:hypothetical protein
MVQGYAVGRFDKRPLQVVLHIGSQPALAGLVSPLLLTRGVVPAQLASRSALAKRVTSPISSRIAGKIICVAMPQKFQTEPRYVNTFLKMLFYTHVLRRFDRPKAERAKDNLLILWAGEAQRFMTASEDGTSGLQLRGRNPCSSCNS